MFSTAGATHPPALLPDRGNILSAWVCWVTNGALFPSRWSLSGHYLRVSTALVSTVASINHSFSGVANWPTLFSV